MVVGQEIEMLPGFVKARVRNIQSHENLVEKVVLGDRAAINLQGIDKKNINRGSQIVNKDFFIQTNQIAAIIELLPNEKNILKHNQRIRIHIGTQEVIARVFFINHKSITFGKKYIAFIKLESVITATMNDKFIIRTFSPMLTLGGGVVVDNKIKGRWKKIKMYLEKIHNNGEIEIDKIIENYSSNPMTLKHAKFKFGISVELLLKKIEKNNKINYIHYNNDKWIVTPNQIKNLKNKVVFYLNNFHENNPYLKGITKEEIRQLLKSNDNFTEYILNDLFCNNIIGKDASFWFIYGYKIKLSDEMKKNIDCLISFLNKEKFSTINSNELLEVLNANEKQIKSILDISINTNQIIKIDGNIIFTNKYFIKIKEDLLKHFNNSDLMSVTDFKNIAHASRKYAVPLLEFFDKNKITYRDGNNRKLVK